jgi:predicted nucleotidyltransferase
LIAAVAERRRERDRLLGLARDYVEGLEGRLSVRAASVVGSLARGDFNLWSDIDVLVIAEDLPDRAPDRGMVLGRDAPARIQPVGMTPNEFTRAVDRGNPLAREARTHGILIAGDALPV